MQREDFRVKYLSNAMGHEVLREDNLWMTGERFHLEIKNISASGINFTSRIHIKIGDEIIIELPVDKEVLKVNCLIVRMDYDQNEGIHSYGAKFVTRDHSLEAKLRGYIYKIQTKEYRK